MSSARAVILLVATLPWIVPVGGMLGPYGSPVRRLPNAWVLPLRGAETRLSGRGGGGILDRGHRQVAAMCGCGRLRGGDEDGGDAEGPAQGEEGDDSVVFLDEDEKVEEQWSGEDAAAEDMQMTACEKEEEEGSDMDSSAEVAEGAGTRLRQQNDDSIGCFPHNQPVYSVAFSPFDMDAIATGGGDDRVRVWSLSSGNEIHALDKFDDTVSSVGYSHDGTYLSGSSMDGSVKVWLAATGDEVTTLFGPSEAVIWMEWHPRGPVVLAGSDDGFAFLWEIVHDGDAYDGRCLHVLAGHAAAVSCGGFADNGRLVVTGCDDATVRIFSPKDGKMLHSMYDEQHLHGSPITALACHPTDPIAVTGDKEGRVHVINVQQGKVKCSFQGLSEGHVGSVEAIDFSRAMVGCVVTGSMDGSMRVWDVATGFERSRCKHKGREGVTRVVCLQRKPMIVTGTTAGRVCVWDGTNGGLLRVFGGHNDIILDLAVHREEELLLTGNDDRTARLFSLMPRRV